MNPTDFFVAAIERAVQIALTNLGAVETTLPDAVRDRSLHALSFALGLPSIWPLTRDLLLALSPWLELQGFRGDWAAVLTQGILLAQDQNDMSANARLRLHLGQLCLLQDDHEGATVQLQTAASLAEVLGDMSTLAACLYRLARSAMLRSLLPDAEHLAQRALQLLAQDDPDTDLCYAALGRVALHRGEWEVAISHYQHSLVGRRKHGRPAHIAPGLRDLGNALMSAAPTGTIS